MKTRVPFVMLLALAGGCAHARGEARFEEIRRAPARLCYAESGVTVMAGDAMPCPDRSEVRAEIAGLLARVAAPASALEGTRVTVVDAWINCGGVSTTGCTSADEVVVLRSAKPVAVLLPSTPEEFDRSGEEARLQRAYDWRRTLVHELGHVLRERAGLPGDVAHRDRDFWRVAETRTATAALWAANDPRSQRFAKAGKRVIAAKRPTNRLELTEAEPIEVSRRTP